MCLSFLGWLHKEVQNSNKMASLKLKRRWFVLTRNSLDYYKTSERTASKLGTLVLNSLCSVVQADEKTHTETGMGRQVMCVGAVAVKSSYGWLTFTDLLLQDIGIL